ncbi:MAG: hypothetical protein HOV94_42625, partial [Saccharothrix sp.]|nr:hypothetical protein [Saccharothrix sp.]
LFVLNHTDAEVGLAASGTELLTGRHCASELRVPAGGVAVLRS